MNLATISRLGIVYDEESPYTYTVKVCRPRDTILKSKTALYIGMQNKMAAPNNI
jgi:hypothetical protein